MWMESAVPCPIFALHRFFVLSVSFLNFFRKQECWRYYVDRLAHSFLVHLCSFSRPGWEAVSCSLVVAGYGGGNVGHTAVTHFYSISV